MSQNKFFLPWVASSGRHFTTELREIVNTMKLTQRAALLLFTLPTLCLLSIDYSSSPQVSPAFGLPVPTQLPSFRARLREILHSAAHPRNLPCTRYHYLNHQGTQEGDVRNSDSGVTSKRNGVVGASLCWCALCAPKHRYSQLLGCWTTWWDDGSVLASGELHDLKIQKLLCSETHCHVCAKTALAVGCWQRHQGQHAPRGLGTL